MKRNKRRNRVLVLVMLVLTISIGFAILSTTLKINGISTIGKNTWNIYWDNIEVTDGSVNPTTAAYIKDSAKTEIEYSVRFNEPGDFYEFTVDAVNNGTLDAVITEIDSKVNGVKVENANLPAYIKYSVKYADGGTVALNDLLKKKKNDVATRKKYRVRVEYDRDLVEIDDINNQQADITYTFNYKVTYSQKVKDYNASVWELPEGKTKEQLETGDELCVDDQCFNFIRYDGNDVVMLAKYNLNVGPNSKGRETFIQDSDVRGYPGDYGMVAFSSDHYWRDNPSTNTQIKPKYGNEWKNNNIYDTDYNTKPDFSGDCENAYSDQVCWYTPGYSIAYYVEKYKEILEGADYNATIKEARLLTYSEALDSTIGCSVDPYTCPHQSEPSSFVSNTTFWISSAKYEEEGTRDEVYTIFWNGDWGVTSYGKYSHYGVRPIIVVTKSNL